MIQAQAISAFEAWGCPESPRARPPPPQRIDVAPVRCRPPRPRAPPHRPWRPRSVTPASRFARTPARTKLSRTRLRTAHERSRGHPFAFASEGRGAAVRTGVGLRGGSRRRGQQEVNGPGYQPLSPASRTSLRDATPLISATRPANQRTRWLAQRSEGICTPFAPVAVARTECAPRLDRTATSSTILVRKPSPPPPKPALSENYTSYIFHQVLGFAPLWSSNCQSCQVIESDAGAGRPQNDL
jgi:hypothetical protein